MRRRTRPTSTKRDQHAILIRMPVDLHKRIVERAEAEERSVTAHVRHVLSESLKEAA